MQFLNEVGAPGMTYVPEDKLPFCFGFERTFDVGFVVCLAVAGLSAVLPQLLEIECFTPSVVTVILQ